MIHTEEAQRMLDAFTSAGAERFFVTKTNVREEKTLAWPTSPERLREVLPAVLRTATVRKSCDVGGGRTIIAGENVIIRPMGRTTAFIQLDDLPADALEKVRPFAFLTLATSPGNHQAWLAVPDLKGKIPEDDLKDFVRRVKKGVGDKSASGAVRLAGTENFKIKYDPDFPRVTIVECCPGRMVTKDQLERLGMLSPPDPVKPPLIPFRASGSRQSKEWPSYQRALERAPAARNHKGPDRSMADFVWCMTSIDWGFGVEATAEKLLEESGKARDRGRDYALQTARNAFTEVEKNRAGQGRNRA
jgi:RepB DNA-primase from phage plasmid